MSTSTNPGDAYEQAVAEAQRRVNGKKPRPAPGEVQDAPTIRIGVDEYRVNEECIAALATDPNLYQRLPGQLVTVTKIGADPKRERHGLQVADDALVIRALNHAALRERLSRVAAFERFDARKKEGEEWVAAHPPEWAAAAILARGVWAGIPSLVGIAEYPVLRSDGSILATSGYDQQTGLYLQTSVKLNVPDNPTRDDAHAAAMNLLRLQDDFPHNDRSKSAWVCGLLTPLARPAIDGPTPCFITTANVRGSGKTLLEDLKSLIVVGRPMVLQTYPEREEEIEKILVGIALQGLPFFSWDNVVGAFGGGTLDKWLTTTRGMGRILGKTEQIACEWRTVQNATGNNCEIHGDTDRRSIHTRLESDLENPESRTDFAIPDIRSHVLERRAAYLSDAFTILRGYALAGRPPQSTRAKGSFESWGRVVRDAAVWAGLEDPELSYDSDERPIDRDVSLLGMILAGWAEYAAGEPRTIRQAIDAVGYKSRQANLPGAGDTDGAYPTLREAFSQIDPRSPPGPREIGQAFKRLARRWAGNRRLVQDLNRHSKVASWKVETR